MAYTNAWSTTSPANTDPASNAATDMRKIRVDVAERIETLIGAGNFSEDPIVVVSPTYSHRIHWSEFQVYSGSASWGVASTSAYGLYSTSTTTSTLYAPVLLPRGVTVIELAAYGANHSSSGTMIFTLESIDATTSTVTQTTHATVSIPVGDSQNRFDSGTVSVTIDSTSGNYIFYYIKLVMTNPASTTATHFQGVELTYTRPNLGTSL